MDVLFRLLQGAVAAALIIFFTLLAAEAGFGGFKEAAMLMVLGLGVYWLLLLLGNRDDSSEVTIATRSRSNRYLSRTTALVLVLAYIFFILGVPL